MTPPRYFISYNREDIDEVGVIAKTLMLHGVKIWQDINNLGLGLAENEIREAIREDCSGLLFYSTKSSVQSLMVRLVELPEAEKKHKSDKSFSIVPIFKLGVKETQNSLKDCLTIPISNFNGAKVGEENPSILLASQEAALKILDTIDLNKGRPLAIGLSSKQKSDKELDLDVDLMSYFSTGVPSQEVWVKEISSAFYNIKNTLLKKKVTHLRLYSFAHLSLGFLFGYIFRERTGFILEIEQITRPERKIWTTNETPEENPLKTSLFPGDLNSKHLCVRINLMSQDDKSITSLCEQTGLSFRVILEISPTQYPFIISNGQGVTIARHLTDKIKQVNAEYGTNTVHMFAAIPLGLSLLIGYNLNACGKVQCYEFDNATRNYFPSCVLDSKY